MGPYLFYIFSLSPHAKKQLLITDIKPNSISCAAKF